MSLFDLAPVAGLLGIVIAAIGSRPARPSTSPILLDPRAVILALQTTTCSRCRR